MADAQRSVGCSSVGRIDAVTRGKALAANRGERPPVHDDQLRMRVVLGPIRTKSLHHAHRVDPASGRCSLGTHLVANEFTCCTNASRA